MNSHGRIFAAIAKAFVIETIKAMPSALAIMIAGSVVNGAVSLGKSGIKTVKPGTMPIRKTSTRPARQTRRAG